MAELQVKQASLLPLAGATLTRTSLSLPEATTYEEWFEVVTTLQHIEGAVLWWLGDALRFGGRYGEKYTQALEATDYSYQTLNDAVWVAGKVEISSRNENLSWSHHRVVAPLDAAEQVRFLRLAEENKWSHRELRAEVKKGKFAGLGAPNLSSVGRAYSQKAGDEPFWAAVYKEAFPSLVEVKDCSGDMACQRVGIDRKLKLASGQTIKVDEKKRKKDRLDIALEYCHSGPKYNAPGWVQKDLGIDYLAYAFMPSRRVYLFPFHLLRRAWCANGEKWLAWAKSSTNGFAYKGAANPGYYTWNVCVPIVTLQQAINEAGRVDLLVNNSTAEYWGVPVTGGLFEEEDPFDGADPAEPEDDSEWIDG